MFIWNKGSEGTMKRMLVVLSLVIVATGFAVRAGDLPVSKSDILTTDVGVLTARPADHPVPWPWGAEMPFPWTFVQGVWFAEQGDFKSYYVVRVVKQKSNVNQLLITQVDPVDCETIATGVGYEQSRIVRAQMSLRSGGGAYRITLRSFNARSIPSGKVTVKPVNNQYVVLSIIPWDVNSGANIPMQLISNRLSFQCRVQQ